MTQEERDRRDLEYLRSIEDADIDMSPEAISLRMERMGVVCELAHRLGMPDIEWLNADYRPRPGRDN